MKKYLVIIKIKNAFNGRKEKLFEAENPAGAIVKANAYIKERKWEAKVVGVFEKVWTINPMI